MSCGYLTAEDDDTFNFACVFLLYFVIFLHLLLKLGPMSGFCESLHSSMLLFSFNEPQLAMRAQKLPLNAPIVEPGICPSMGLGDVRVGYSLLICHMHNKIFL